MNIGLIDVDGGKFPNLALGKIAAYHRAMGDCVEWADQMFGVYDRVYASKVFNFTPDFTDLYEYIKDAWKAGYVEGNTVRNYFLCNDCPKQHKPLYKSPKVIFDPTATARE